MKTVPNLLMLRAFEASARHLNFSRAASELNVTPAAVSHQIKELEKQVGAALFVRSNRIMTLTGEGELLHAATKSILENWLQALSRIRKLSSSSQLRITTSASIAAKWLVPRLERFLASNRGADVRIDVSQSALDLERDDVDIAIRFGNGNYPGMRAERLFDETVFPVCSRSLMNRPHPLREPRDLLKHNLIHLDWQAQDAVWPNWRMWMLAAGIKDFDDTPGLHFSLTSLAIQAAIDGQGVALGESTLVADDLAAGRLVRPFELTLNAPPSFAYYLVRPEAAEDAPLVRAFREWILQEARDSKLGGKVG